MRQRLRQGQLRLALAESVLALPALSQLGDEPRLHAFKCGAAPVHLGTPVHGPGDRRLELGDIGRLEQEIVGPCTDGLHGGLNRAESGEHDPDGARPPLPQARSSCSSACGTLVASSTA
jgi:hypothetical protein